MDFELLRSVIINSAIVTALFGIFTMILNSIRNRKGRSNLLKIDFIGLLLFFLIIYVLHYIRVAYGWSFFGWLFG